VFLDFDGVVNSAKTWGYVPPRLPFDDHLCRRVGKLVMRTGAYVVASTAWRTFREFDEALKTVFAKAGIPMNRYIGKTPVLYSNQLTEQVPRAAEVQAWLTTQQQRGVPVEAYVILDDMEHFGGMHHVWCDPDYGFTEGNLAAAVKILGGTLDTRSQPNAPAPARAGRRTPRTR
jgi:hypothetical protein